MRSIAMTVILLALTGASAFAQDPKCNCTIVPFKPSPPCLDICCTRVLTTSTFEELELILGVQRETARRIVEWKGREKAKTLEDFEKILSSEEIKNLSGKINSLSEGQLEYFGKSPIERTEITSKMKALFRINTAISNQ
jgi:hypothetical protein